MNGFQSNMNQKLTIVQVIPSLQSGGVEKGTLEIAKYLAHKGHESIVISGGGRLSEQLKKEGSTHIKWNIGKKSILTLFYIFTVIKLIKNKKIDVIHARSRLPAWIIYLALKFIRKSLRPLFITTVHGFNSVSMYSSIMTKGDKVIAVSKTIQKFIVQHYKVDPSKIFLNYRGVDSALYDLNKSQKTKINYSLKEEFPNLKNKIILSLPSRISKRKGHEDFIDLIYRLKQDGLNIQGLIIGDPKSSSDRYLKVLKKQINKKKLNKFITFTGYRNDVRNIIVFSDIVFSLSSEPESFGRTVIESIKLKTPFIGYDHGGVGEQLKILFPEGLVESKNQEQLYENTKKILNEKPRIKTTKLFDLETMCKNTLKIYQSRT